MTPTNIRRRRTNFSRHGDLAPGIYAPLFLSIFSIVKFDFILSYSVPLRCAECDDSLPCSGTSSIPLCFILYPATLIHQLFFHLPSLHLSIHFLVYLLVLLFPNSYPFAAPNVLKRTGYKCRLLSLTY
jgi:hypothetical protein